MSKEFVWNVTVGDEKKEWKCILLEDEVVTYENETECEHLKITNPEVKQGVLQIDTVVHIYGQEARFQLEKNVPYIKLDKEWSISKTTFQERKNKAVKEQKTVFTLLMLIGIGACLACLLRWLIMGSMGDWWFMLVMGTIVMATAYIQRYEMKTQLEMIEQKDE